MAEMRSARRAPAIRPPTSDQVSRIKQDVSALCAQYGGTRVSCAASSALYARRVFRVHHAGPTESTVVFRIAGRPALCGCSRLVGTDTSQAAAGDGGTVRPETPKQLTAARVSRPPVPAATRVFVWGAALDAVVCLPTGGTLSVAAADAGV